MNRIGRYEILEELGRGAMGAVYKARDSQIGRTVAIKVILTANLSKDDLEHFKKRFYQEARTAGQMSHPGIVTIHDIAEAENGQPYLVMEFVPGLTLEKLLTSAEAAKLYGLQSVRGGFPMETCVDVGIQLADALDYAHKQGVIHRDIKPANILVALEKDPGASSSEASPRMRVKITDFGIAKIAGANLTQTGMAMGTPAFMSPEQVSMSPVDGRSDLFSLGGVIYWMLTGEKPFAGESLTQITFKVVFGSPLPVAVVNPKLPPALDVVLSRCLAKNADDRYATGRELAADLELIRAGKPLSTTMAPVSDITLTQLNPLPAVAGGLPAEQRAAKTEGTAAMAGTMRVGSQSEVAPPVAPAASAPSPAQAPHEPQPEIAPQKAPAPRKPQPDLPVRPAARSNTMPMLLVTALVVVLLGGGYFVMQRKTSKPVAQPTTPAVEQPAPAATQVPADAQANPPAPPEPSSSTVAPAPEKSANKEVTKPVPKVSDKPGKPSSTASTPPVKNAEPPPPETKKPAALVATSALQIECHNNFDAATLTITLDGKQIVNEKMADKKPFTTVKPIATGTHKLVVHVVSEPDKFDQEQPITGDFETNGTRLLVIDFGKGFLGMQKRKLAVKWGE
jgi:serine/threonine protein kinase